MFQTSKWAMQAHFWHLRFNIFPMIQITFQRNEFWCMQSRFEDSGIHLGFQLPTLEFTWECEGSFPHTLCTPGNMWCDSRVFFLARNLAKPCLGHEPNARVAIAWLTSNTIFMVYPMFIKYIKHIEIFIVVIISILRMKKNCQPY
jgi:hypothetical protein